MMIALAELMIIVSAVFVWTMLVAVFAGWFSQFWLDVKWELLPFQGPALLLGGFARFYTERDTWQLVQWIFFGVVWIWIWWKDRDKDDRWKKRRAKLAGKVKVDGHRLVVVEERG